MATMIWYAEIGVAYFISSFALAVIIGRCLRSNAVDYPTVDEYVAPMSAEMAAFEPEDCVEIDSRARIRPVNFANLRRKNARTAEHPQDEPVAAAEAVAETVR
jgi:hypothetical protein